MVKKFHISVVVLIVIITIGAAGVLSMKPAQITSRTVVSGLIQGDTFTYSIKGYSNVYDLNATIPATFSQLNQTEWYKVTITNVTGPDVSFDTTWRFTNGTELTSSSTGNILTEINDQQFWAIYPANLTLNSLVRPSGSPSGAIVNQTETRTYQSGERQTNVMTEETQITNPNDPTHTTTCDDYTYVHFDALTGMLVELKDIQIYNNPQIVLTLDWQLQSTNVWTIS